MTLICVPEGRTIMTKVEKSIGLTLVSVNLTLAAGEYVSFAFQHGFSGCAFTIMNEHATEVMNTVAITSDVRSRLEAAGFTVVRVGQALAIMSAASRDAEPSVFTDGKQNAITYATTQVLDAIEMPEKDPLPGMLVASVLGASVARLFK